MHHMDFALVREVPNVTRQEALKNQKKKIGWKSLGVGT
jgi:hypothetical protein